MTEVKPKQPKKTLDSIEVTEFGILIEVRFEQPAKAEEPINVTVSGMVTSVSPQQL